MNLCENGHEEVCHEGRTCPACLLNVDIADSQQELEKRDIVIAELNELVARLEATIKERDAELAEKTQAAADLAAQLDDAMAPLKALRDFSAFGVGKI